LDSEMMALVFRGPQEMSVERRPRPLAEPGAAVVSVTAAGICGSELTSFTGASTRRAPGRVFGHELAGTVRAVGDGVAAERIGSRVTVNPLVPCGRCSICLNGRSNACPSRVLLGMQVDGGFAEEVSVPASALHDLGALDDVGGSLVEPLANAVHVARLLPGVLDRRILVLGAGAIGLSVVTVLRGAGAVRITVVDPVAARRALALDSGAHESYGPDDPELNGLQPDHIVDAAGTTASRRDVITRCAPGGTIVLLGLHSAESELPVNSAVAKELRLQCSYAYTPDDFEAALSRLRQSSVPYQPWITELALDQGQAAFEALVERPDEVTKIVLRPQPATW
jgi:threonine dehydrogenase-like Zn-dependent dehydrogenase